MGRTRKEVAAIRAILELLAEQDNGINAIEVLADATVNFLLIQSKPTYLNEAFAVYVKSLEKRLKIAEHIGMKENADKITAEMQECEKELEEEEKQRKIDISNN